MIEQRIITKDGQRVLQQREVTNMIQYINREEPPNWTEWQTINKDYKGE